MLSRGEGEAGRGGDVEILSTIFVKIHSPGMPCFVKTTIHLLYFIPVGQLFSVTSPRDNIDRCIT